MTKDKNITINLSELKNIHSTLEDWVRETNDSIYQEWLKTSLEDEDYEDMAYYSNLLADLRISKSKLEDLIKNHEK